MAGTSKKIKDAAMHAAKERLPGSKNGKQGGGSGGGADKAKQTVRDFLK
ncbi:MAG TPA: hypothetical protein VKA73_06650 [Rubrobacter sp.]|nr:hypothetical protein [Rubrobacter sp.]